MHKDHIVGWLNFPMGFEPCSLGARPIKWSSTQSEDAEHNEPKNKSIESFRHFAPSVLDQDVSNQFEMNANSPYMLLVAPVKKELCKQMKISAFVTIATVIGGSFLIPNSASAQYYGGGYGYNNNRNSYGYNQYSPQRSRVNLNSWQPSSDFSRPNRRPSDCSSFSMSSACY